MSLPRFRQPQHRTSRPAAHPLERAAAGPSPRKTWPSFRRVLLSMLAVDAGVAVIVWIAWHLSAI